MTISVKNGFWTMPMIILHFWSNGCARWVGYIGPICLQQDPLIDGAIKFYVLVLLIIRIYK